MTRSAAGASPRPDRPVMVAARMVWRLCLVTAGMFATLAAMSLWSGRTDRGYLLAAVASAALITAGLISWWRAAHRAPQLH